jgi:hypothetical protein
MQKVTFYASFQHKVWLEGAHDLAMRRVSLGESRHCRLPLLGGKNGRLMGSLPYPRVVEEPLLSPVVTTYHQLMLLQGGSLVHLERQLCPRVLIQLLLLKRDNRSRL